MRLRRQSKSAATQFVLTSASPILLRAGFLALRLGTQEAAVVPVIVAPAMITFVLSGRAAARPFYFISTASSMHLRYIQVFRGDSLGEPRREALRPLSARHVFLERRAFLRRVVEDPGLAAGMQSACF